MANMKKENSKTWSKEAIDASINCFQSRECIWNVTSGDYKDQNREFLPLKEFDMSVHKYNINRYGYKNGKISDVNFYYFRKNVPPQPFNLVLNTPQKYCPEPI